MILRLLAVRQCEAVSRIITEQSRMALWVVVGFRLRSVFFLLKIIAKRVIRTQKHGNRQQTPVVEHKGAFSRRVVFQTYTPNLQRFRVLCNSALPFSICLAPGECPPTTKKPSACGHWRMREATHKAFLQAARTHDYARPSAFMRPAPVVSFASSG